MSYDGGVDTDCVNVFYWNRFNKQIYLKYFTDYKLHSN